MPQATNPVDPLTVIAEILGEPATNMRSPVNAGYECPFIASQCMKRSHRIAGPYPVCSVFRSQRDRDIICVCPKRFYEIDLATDILQNCWVGAPPANPKLAFEVKMATFGNVDFVIADVDEARNAVREFISVELQAVDLTGSVEPSYTAIVSNVAMLDERPSYGVNWANVRKRYVSQLVTKGFYHHHWGTRMVSVLQHQLYIEFKRSIHFDELDPKSPNANIVFVTYDYVDAPEKGIPGAKKLVMKTVIGTSHNSLMMAALYHTPPAKERFCKKILERL